MATSTTPNVWWYVKIIKWLGEVLQEYGIKINVVNEHGTSKQCSICNANHENGRVKWIIRMRINWNKD